MYVISEEPCVAELIKTLRKIPELVLLGECRRAFSELRLIFSSSSFFSFFFALFVCCIVYGKYINAESVAVTPVFQTYIERVKYHWFYGN